MKNRVDFDDYSQDYQKLVTDSAFLCGEADDYFDQYKINCLRRWVIGTDSQFDILDFGCGIGKQTVLMAKAFPKASVVGFDISKKSVAIAREKFTHVDNLQFDDQLPAQGCYDVILVANVFHHIPLEDRLEILADLKDRLKPDGRIVIFEHNPLNPLTRYTVNACPFDADAVLVWPNAFIRLARRVGIEVDQKRYIVFFPGFLKIFRRIESHLGWLPIGAQYMLTLKKM
ncbi:MAG: SAM-dependent methyltransferase [Candidatus Latescibacterota bacterium]|jgi:SAM-dependent methyltransferase